jgi:photoactive yellow protein
VSAGTTPAGRHDCGADGPRFSDPELLDALESASPADIDGIGFGLVVMDRDGTVLGYNQRESRLSGLPPAQVTGRNFFADIGPCANNFLVAQRYADSDELDEQLDYVFTFRMAPTPVRLRLLARKGSPRQYLAVQPR